MNESIAIFNLQCKKNKAGPGDYSLWLFGSAYILSMAENKRPPPLAAMVVL